MTQSPTFQEGARVALQDAQLRRNLRAATHTIRAKRAAVVSELPDWEELRAAGRDIKAHTMRHLDRYLLELEASVQRAGGQVHWAADADSANRLVIELVRRAPAREG
ncbi:MAG TPA: (4Fe-4S)-binding protein, partial [Chloroflexota bacterium]